MAMPHFGKSATKFDVHDDFNKDKGKRKITLEVSIKAVMTEGIFSVRFTLS